MVTPLDSSSSSNHPDSAAAVESPEALRLAENLWIGHHRQREWFRNAIRSGRLGSTFLFVGPEGIGKRTFALQLAKTLLCERSEPAELAPCGDCSACRQVAAGTHPDVLQVRKPDDRSYIPVEILIGPREARMREGLCHDIRLRPMSGERRIAILDDADVLNAEGANCLLKTLEEPPPRAVIILIGTSLQRQLPTIRSRCQVVRFDPPPRDEAVEILRLHAAAAEVSEEQLRAALDAADGELSRAATLLSEESRHFQQTLHAVLGDGLPSAVELAKLVGGYVDAAGSDAPPRRQRMRQVSELAADHFRRRLRAAATSGTLSGPSVAEDLYRLNRSLEMRYQIDRNANQATLIEAWADDLQRGRPGS
ncbi:DNA polymerase III subunit [Candidatus Laterigemmans baculatus]|uniref:DNA polymerase III subunit n=1 Tax=Candidatus Laterigemmans baculatus TaxID=2770505 RepID=UPI0013DAEC12|nr:DNA polymerase III subunit [Candidatus Laterigemmans baculatus]